MNAMSRRDGRGEGFALVELTIVVLVILILVGLAIPRSSQVPDADHQARCIANIRSIEMAVTRWEQANRASFPQGWIDLSGLGGGGEAAYDLKPYVDGIGAFDCPIARNPGGEYYYIQPRNDLTNRYAAYFPGVNCYFYGRPAALSSPNPHTSFIKDPY